MNRTLRNPIFWIVLSALAGAGAITRVTLLDARAQAEPRHLSQGKQVEALKCTDTILYRNDTYGLVVQLPESWKGYSVVKDEWQGLETQTGDASESGPFLSVRNPKWTEQKPTQDIPVYIFTNEQWDNLQHDYFHIGAAPIGPSLLARNEKYVFALPARYNFAFPEGWEEVDELLQNGAVKAIEPSLKN